MNSLETYINLSKELFTYSSGRKGNTFEIGIKDTPNEAISLDKALVNKNEVKIRG